MTKKVSIINCGIGNLLSIKRAFDQFPHTSTSIVNNPFLLRNSDIVILPGVGAFKDGMSSISKLGFINEIKEHSLKERPLIGICLGMQLFFDYSTEFGNCTGLGLLKGRVDPLPQRALDDNQIKINVPHIGWSSINTKSHPLFTNISKESEYYFCHSYQVKPEDESCVIAYYDYGGHQITACIAKKNILGFQFHPEKSGPQGLHLIKNILAGVEISSIIRQTYSRIPSDPP